MPIFGITASSNMSTKLTDFYQIATTTVGAGGTSLISFTSIPQTYTHLQIRALNFSSNPAAGGVYRFNNDTTTTNYYDHFLYSTGTGGTPTSAGSDANASYAPFFQGGSSSTAPGSMVIDILDYTNTNKYKVSKQLVGYTNTSPSAMYLGLISNLWESTSAINRIDFTAGSAGTFSQYTQFSLYGVKA